MSELIDKQVAIDAMQKLIITDDEEGLMLMEYNQAVTDCIDKVAELPPVEQKQGWIPVSERLPETNDNVLVYDGVDMFIAWYAMKGVWIGWNNTSNDFEKNTPIIAWMPLPEPYKASPTGAESEVQDADCN